MEQKKVNLSINEGDIFFSEEVAVIHGPTKFILDFKSVTPRFDLRNQNGTQPMVIKHAPIMLDPWMAKDLVATLHDNIKKYEEKFGEIKKPKQLEKMEKEMKVKHTPETSTTPNQALHYMG